MTRRNLPLIIFFNILGIVLFLSWYLPANHGYWFTLDSEIFFFFNRHLATDPGFLHLVAITNNRAFDVISLLAMGLLYLCLPAAGWRRASPLVDYRRCYAADRRGAEPAWTFAAGQTP